MSYTKKILLVCFLGSILMGLKIWDKTKESTLGDYLPKLKVETVTSTLFESGTSWRDRVYLQAETAAEDLQELGFFGQEIQNMLDLGYTAAGIKEQWNACKSKTEKQFFHNLMEGSKQSYIEAFRTEPYALSGDMTFIMSEYSYRLLIQSQPEKLADMTNAILSSERYQVRQGYEEYCYRDVYLKRLYSGTAILLESDSTILAAMNMDADGYAPLFEMYQQRAAMTNLWATEEIVVDYLNTHYTNGEEAHQLSVSDILYDDYGAVSFDFTRYSPSYGDYVTNSINGDFLAGGDFVEDELRLLYLQNN